MRYILMKKLPVLLVVDEGAGVGRFKRIPDELYGTIKEAVPIYCVDIIPVDMERERIYLAKRRRQPRRDWWWPGGRVGQDELPENAGTRKLKEELGLTVAPERIQMVGIVLHYINEPGSRGTFPVVQLSFETTPKEMANAQLDPDEYDQYSGVIAFDRVLLVSEKVDGTVLAFYDAMFRHHLCFPQKK